MSLNSLFSLILKGGSESGNKGHAGIPGHLGGSASGGSMTIRGDELGQLYHGGKKKLDKLDESKFNQRDAGFYGPGFYVTSAPHYAKTYGKVLSKLTVKPEAKVLNANLNPSNMSDSERKIIKDYYFEKNKPIAEKRGKLENLRAEADDLDKSNISWIAGVNTYAIGHNYDVVKFSDGEIVIRNPKVVEFNN